MQTYYDYDQYMKLLETPNNELQLQSIYALHWSGCRSDIKRIFKLPKLPPNLHTLDCSYHPITDLSGLPSTLRSLKCFYNQLQILPDSLPPTLRRLDCAHNQLIKLPDSLPPTLQRLYCNNNQLRSLPGTIPPTLQTLDCNHNQLRSLPDSLPPTLQELYCSHNSLLKLPDSLPPTLLELYCFENQLQKLPGTLPPTLQTLTCSHNQLTQLPDSLPPTLQRLNCSVNQLTQLPGTLPPTLQYLDCCHNQLHKLPESLPPSLQYISCSHNQLTTLPNSIIHTQCIIHYSNNPIEYLPVQITRWLNRVNNKTSQQVYQDTQSVHNHSIQLGIMDAVTWLTQSKPSVVINQVIEAIVCEANESFQFQPKSKQLLLEYCGDLEVHGTFQLTFAELLVAVWSHILTYPIPIKNEIWKVMDTEMQDAECKCFTGRMSRLVNCLNGFDDRIKIQISDNEQIGNIIAVERTRLASFSDLTDSDLISLLKTNVTMALKERAYSDTVIQEWIEYIE